MLFTGVGRSHSCDITGPAGTVGREAAGLRVGGGRAATQLWRRDQVRSAEAIDGRGVWPPGGRHVHHNDSGRVRQGVYGGFRAGRLATSTDYYVGQGHSEEYSRHPQAADQHGDGRRTAERAKRPGRCGRSKVGCSDGAKRYGYLGPIAIRRPVGACSTRVFFLKTEMINVHILLCMHFIIA